MNTFNLDKWSKLALFQEKLSDQVVRCHLCPHNCIIGVEKSGICTTRVNVQGDLYTLAYGNPCSLNIDPIEKKPLFHFFPGSQIYSIATVGCNLRCLNCQNWEISQSSPQDMFHYNLLPKDVVKQTLNHHINLIAFTYTEPTVYYEYMLDTAKVAHEEGLKTVMVSNGYINEKPLLDLCPYLDAANIDLKCFDDLMYRQLTGGRLQPVLDSLKVLKNNGIWLEITNLLVPTFTDSPEMIRKMCRWLFENGFGDTPIHFSSFFPHYQLSHLPLTSDRILILAKEIAQEAGLKFVYTGNQPSLDGVNTYCPNCKQLLVQRKGYYIAKNLISNGKCPFCQETIAGFF